MPIDPQTGQWTDVEPTPQVPPAPQSGGYSPESAMDRVALAQYLSQVDPRFTRRGGMAPQTTPNPGIHIGHHQIASGHTMDTLLPYLSALTQTLGAPGNEPYSNQGAAIFNVAKGLMGGYLGSQGTRIANNKLAEKNALHLEDQRRQAVSGFAKGMAEHRWRMQEQAARGGAAGGRRIPNTPQVQAYAQAHHIAIPTPDVAPDIPESALMRDESVPSQPDPYLEEMRRANLQKLHDDQANEEAMREQTASGIADFSIDPRRVPRDKNFRYIEVRSNQLLAGKPLPNGRTKPYTIRELQTLKDEQERFYKTMDQNQMTNFRQAAITTRQHLDQFENLYRKYADRKPPSGIRAIGKGTYQMALEGLLGEDAQADAKALEPVADALPVEIAKVIAGGRAPYEKELGHAMKAYVEPWLRNRAAASKIASTKQLIEARIRTQMNAMPFAGGKDNPYLIDVSPIEGWNEGGVQAVAKNGDWFNANRR